MHEFHLLRQVVKAVEEGMGGIRHGRPVVVRLRVSHGSHLLSHDPATLQHTFALAARGSVAEGADLELLTVVGEARCVDCGRVASMETGDEMCAACGGPLEIPTGGPEVVVHEVVVEE
ncbi:hydrogenase maturation nickel metallochaperone HypA [Nitrospira sp.]|nr:hydrogenase maturation nickel metallochaperone HypA [Nitrospira sp.]